MTPEEIDRNRAAERQALAEFQADQKKDWERFGIEWDEERMEEMRAEREAREDLWDEMLKSLYECGRQMEELRHKERQRRNGR